MHCVGEGVRDLEAGLPGFGFQLCSVTCLVFHSFFFFHLMVDLFYSSMCWWVRTVHTVNTAMYMKYICTEGFTGYLT